MALPVTITGISTAISCVGPFRATGQAGSYVFATTQNTQRNLGSVSGAQAVGQPFTGVANSAVASGSVNLWWATGSPSDKIVAEVRDGGVDGDVLGTSSQITVTSSTPTNYNFTFTPTVPVTSGTYAIVFRRTGAADNSNYYQVSMDLNNPFSQSDAATYTSGSWTTVTGLDIVATLLLTGPIYYFFGRDGTTATTLQAFVATDPTSSWSTVNSQTGYSTAIQALAGVIDSSDIIHLAIIDGSGTSVNLKYIQFNPSNNGFASSETVQSGFNPQTNAAANVYACSICIQGSQPTILYNGAQVASMGSSYSALYERHRTGASSWSAGQQVTATAQLNNSNPEAIAGGSSRAHFFWGTNNPNEHHRSINSSYTLSGTTQTLGSALSNLPLNAVSYDSSGTIKVHMARYGSGSSYFGDSADVPTWTASSSGTNATLVRAFSTGTTLWQLYRDSSDSDLYARSSTNNGSSFGSAATAFVGTVADAEANLSIDGKIYQRGNSIVIPYIVNDNGTLKYNEYEVLALAPDAWSPNDKSSTITLSNQNKTATASASSPGVRLVSGRSTGNARKYYAEFVIDNFISGTNPFVGLQSSTASIGGTTDVVYVRASDGLITVESTSSGVSIGGFADGDVISMVWHPSANLVWFRKNAGNWNNNASADPSAGTNGIDVSAFAAGTYHLLTGMGANLEAVTVRTEHAEFTQTVPSGVYSWMEETLDAWSAGETFFKSTEITLSALDKTATTTTSASTTGVRSTTGHYKGTSEKYYAEFVLTNVTTSPSPRVGIKRIDITTSHINTSQTILMGVDGDIQINGAASGSDAGTAVEGDVICFAWDVGADRVWFRINSGNWNGDGSANPATNTNGIDYSGTGGGGTRFALWARMNANTESVTIRTEAAEFTQTPPSGFKSWMDETLEPPPTLWSQSVM